MPEANYKQYQSTIARIYDSENKVVGAGFLVTGGYVLTCAHVITAALSISDSAPDCPLQEVKLDFPMADSQEDANGKTKEVWAEVIVWFSRDDGSKTSDIAGLKLKNITQLDIKPMQLDSLQEFAEERKLKIFGFPNDFINGRMATTTPEGTIVNKWIQVKSTDISAIVIDEGFSGAPVLDVKMNSIVGMIVARDTSQPGVSFFIPKEVLIPALNKLDLHSLAQILEPKWQAHQELFREAYQIAHPDKHYKSFTSVGEILQHLNDLPKALQKFAVCLVAKQILGLPVNEELRQWVMLKIQSQEYAQLLSWSLQEWEMQQANYADPHLLVQVSPTKPPSGAYSIDAWFVRNTSAYDPESGIGSEPCEFDKNKLIQLENIPNLIKSCLEKLDQRIKTSVSVDVFLPIECLSYAIDHWKEKSEFDTEIPLYFSQKIHMRSYDKISRAYSRKIQWKEKWEKLKENLRVPANKVLKSQKPIPTNIDKDEFSRLVAVCMDSKSLFGLRLEKVIPVDANQASAKELVLILMAGIPVALWLRRDLPEAKYKKVLRNILKCETENLLEEVREKRKEAFKRASAEDHLEHHISLLWDDFSRVPPQKTFTSTKL